MNRFKLHYDNVIIYDLITKFNYKNIFEIPKFNKIILNIGSVECSIKKKKIIPMILILQILTGQKAFITKSKKNQITLKIKKGTIVGCKVSLRKENLFNFLENYFLFIISKLKEFKGISINKKNNNLISFQVSNILDFIEIENEFFKFRNVPSMDVTIQSTSKTKEEFLALFNSFNFPIYKN